MPRRLPHALALLACLAASPAAFAQTLWQCWLDDQHIACQLLSHRPAAAPAPAALLQPVSLTAPPRATAALPVLQVLRQQPGLLQGQVMRIPLYTVPFETSALAELAQAVMCGPLPDCRARFGDLATDTPEAAALFADANDPLLAGR